MTLIFSKILLIFYCLSFAQVAFTQEKIANKKPAAARHNVWNFGLTGNRHYLKAGNGNEVLGNSSSINLGTGYISDSWYVLGSFDIILGPYEPAFRKQLDVDFFGTGITVWTGFSAQTLNLRSPDGGYGFALGFSYADVVGRSIGKNRKQTNSKIKNNDLVDNYSIKTTNFSLLPAVFFSWLEEARPRGNTPELLKTRLDGYFLTMGIAMPLFVTYHAKYEKRDQYEIQDDQIVKTKDSEIVSPKGQLRGYSLVITFTSLLGT